jgi:hypothetical protein
MRGSIESRRSVGNAGRAPRPLIVHDLVDLQGRVVARVPAYPRPGTTDHVTLERIGVRDATLRLQRLVARLIASFSWTKTAWRS